VTTNPRCPTLIQAIARLRQLYATESNLVEQQQAALYRLLHHQQQQQRGGPSHTTAPPPTGAARLNHRRPPPPPSPILTGGSTPEAKGTPLAVLRRPAVTTAWHLPDEEEAGKGAPPATTPVRGRPSTEARLARLDAYTQSCAARFGCGGPVPSLTPSPVLLGS